MTAAVDLVSFDGTEACTASVATPDRYRELRARLAEPGPHTIRGAGLSYALASAATGATALSTRYFDRILAHDPERRQVTVEPGLTVGALLRFAVAQGLHVPVLPGHPSITVGGCAGFNVHGKSQHDVGLFSDHVVALTLLHPDHGELRCGRDENPELFELTLGGMGLTGYVASLTLQLPELPGRAVRRAVVPVGDLVEAVEVMTARRATGEALYSWHDLNRRGRGFGRGMVYAESFVDGEPPTRTTYRRLEPGRRGRGRPAGARPVVAAVNLGYRTRERLRPGDVRSVEDAAFPINGSEVYYRLFGRRGFREYQLVVPTEAWATAADDLARIVRAADVPVTLGSLKLFAGEPHLLWFRQDGVCLALDAPEGEATHGLFARLDELAIEYGCVVNLSKDSRVDAATVRAVYPGYDEFRRRLHEFDPHRRFDSMLRRRIDV
jgi:decaprenylphospho-beta-D-ribofuranose 2-oxidase